MCYNYTNNQKSLGHDIKQWFKTFYSKNSFSSYEDWHNTLDRIWSLPSEDCADAQIATDRCITNLFGESKKNDEDLKYIVSEIIATCAERTLGAEDGIDPYEFDLEDDVALFGESDWQ